jgi:F0F1-type ATP synthase assembly protein I
MNFSLCRSRNSEVRQRKRAENQKALADKVREIKRKQRETEDKCSKQSKKRRSLIISLAAGAFIGALCIYLYSKFN